MKLMTLSTMVSSLLSASVESSTTLADLRTTDLPAIPGLLLALGCAMSPTQEAAWLAACASLNVLAIRDLAVRLTSRRPERAVAVLRAIVGVTGSALALRDRADHYAATVEVRS